MKILKVEKDKVQVECNNNEVFYVSEALDSAVEKMVDNEGPTVNGDEYYNSELVALQEVFNKLFEMTRKK